METGKAITGKASWKAYQEKAIIEKTITALLRSGEVRCDCISSLL
jgi:hypothetical protein